MRTFTTLAAFYAAVKSGEIDESKVRIELDNDGTCFAEGECYDEDDDAYDERQIKVEEANGYQDIEPLYKLLFPLATVEWC